MGHTLAGIPSFSHQGQNTRFDLKTQTHSLVTEERRAAQSGREPGVQTGLPGYVIQAKRQWEGVPEEMAWVLARAWAFWS